jgi:predicted DNA binding CopG/RHH family protein
MDKGSLREAIENSKIGKPGKDTEHIIPSIEEMTVEKTVEKKEEIEEINKEKNYKKMYFELKKKHDELLRYVKELLDSIKDTDN